MSNQAPHDLASRPALSPAGRVLETKSSEWSPQRKPVRGAVTGQLQCNFGHLARAASLAIGPADEAGITGRFVTQTQKSFTGRGGPAFRPLR